MQLLQFGRFRIVGDNPNWGVQRTLHSQAGLLGVVKRFRKTHSGKKVAL
jgi:hypothetical protein